MFFDLAISYRESCPTSAPHANEERNSRRPAPRGRPWFASWLEGTLDIVNAGVERALSAAEISYTNPDALELDQDADRR